MINTNSAKGLMKPSQTNRLENSDGQSEMATLFIVGDHTFNNDVLANFLETQTGFACACLKNDELLQLRDKISGKTSLLFLDCATMKNVGMGNSDLVNQKLQLQDFRVIWFNADRRANLEIIALRQGVKGVLYANQSAELYVTAAKAVWCGELWYPREILENIILGKDSPVAMTARARALLTYRERGILRLVALGMKNREIARELCISAYTVRTHIYNIFRKIEVNNRFKAVQWLCQDQPE